MNDRLGTFVAGIADVDDADPCLEPAIALAESVGATLHLVHVFSPPGPLFSPPAAEEIERIRNEVKSRLQSRAEDAGAEGRFICHAVTGSTADVILDTAEQEGADLILVGATRRSALAGAVLGTTAQRVLRASPLPVLVNRRPGRGRPHRVLFTTDLSDLSAGVHRLGLPLVTDLWGGRDFAVRSLFVAGDDVLLPPPAHQFALRAKAEERLATFLESVASAEVVVEGKVRLGMSGREIIAEAEEWDADLLVLGTHGRTGASRFLIGSVAESVVLRAPCDVLLIPASAPAPADGENDRLA